LVNAVLRALARGWREVALPEAGADLAGHLAVRFSHPRWLVEELLAQSAPAQVEAWLAANQEPSPVALRVNTLRGGRDELVSLLAEAGIQTTPHALCPESLVLAGAAGAPAGLPGFRQGLWQMQDPAASAVTTLLGVRPGQSVLDLCAGAGGKTGHLAALMENQGRLLAVDNSPGRLAALEGNLARLGVTCAQTLSADAASLDNSLGQFQRILLDAPCSGLGTVGRRPDLRWRKTPQDPARLAALQLQLLARAADLLAPGGALLYVTCTVTRAENQQTVAALLAQRPDLRIEWDLATAGPAAAAIGQDGFFRTQPHHHACDAFFAARLVRG
jgi:16S rRNA (cytosine967-C5)-methyltransferase